jgi:uncharacterized protein (TIRG00374 family)
MSSTTPLKPMTAIISDELPEDLLTAPPAAGQMPAEQMPAEQMPAELSPRRVRRRLLESGAVIAAVAVLVLVGPGLGDLRDELERANGGWVLAGVGFEVLSALSYVVVFRWVFCRRMSWRFSYQVGMAEQGANSVLSVSGAGGLALGAWALRRGGMSTEHIARRTVAFFFLTSMANVGAMVLLAGLYALGIVRPDRNPALTYSFGVAALVATLLVVVVIPAVLKPGTPDSRPTGNQRKLAAAARFARDSLGQGVRDGLSILRQRSIGVIASSVGTMVFDMAVLWAGFRAFGYAPSLGTLALGYLIGQLGGNLPVPGGIGGVDAGLIGTLVLFHQPLAVSTAAVLIYHAIALWVPALLGSVAFVHLRRTLGRETGPAGLCAPPPEPIDVAPRALAA